MSPTKKTSSAAVVSVTAGFLVAACVNLHGSVLLTMLLSTVAIVGGHFARSAIRGDPDRLDGNAMAITGLAIGYLGLASGIIAFLLLNMAFKSFGGR